MKYIEGWIHRETPLEVVFEYENYLLSNAGSQEAIETIGAHYDKEDLMMLILFNKFKKYESFTVADALNLNIQEEFNKMFSADEILLIMFNYDLKELAEKN